MAAPHCSWSVHLNYVISGSLHVLTTLKNLLYMDTLMSCYSNCKTIIKVFQQILLLQTPPFYLFIWMNKRNTSLTSTKPITQLILLSFPTFKYYFHLLSHPFDSVTILIFANYELAAQAVILIVLCMYFLFDFQTYTLVHVQPLLELTPRGWPSGLGSGLKGSLSPKVPRPPHPTLTGGAVGCSPRCTQAGQDTLHYPPKNQVLEFLFIYYFE